MKERQIKVSSSWTELGSPERLPTDLLHVEAGVGRRVGSSQVIPQEVVAVHLRLEAGDVTVAEIFTELIDLLQLQQVDPQHLNGLHHLNISGPKNSSGNMHWRALEVGGDKTHF